MTHGFDLSFDRLEEHFLCDAATDAVWERLVGEAKHACATDPALCAIMTEDFLGLEDFYGALRGLLSRIVCD